jgi:DNA gyrase subunit A
MQFIPGPDFPTGGVVYRFAQEGNGEDATQMDVIAHAYAGGKGSIVMQAKAHIEDMSRNRSRIVVTELPYMANKTNLLERIAELVRDGRLEGITDLRDESDRTGMRICIEMTRTVEPRQVLADLFKLTPLQTTFGVSLLALVDGEPRLLSLKRMLLHFIEHRQEVIVRRSRHDLEKARHRAHILEGLLRALDVLDEVIALIRKSRTAETARQNLIEEFKFTEVQAQAILDMQLRRLAALERRRLQDEYREVIALIRDLEALLASPKKILELIRQNLVDLKARFGDARRTQIADRVKGTLTAMDVLPDEDIWVTLAADGSLARQRRRGEGDWESGRKGVVLPFSHSPTLLIAANTRHNLYLFSAKGQATRVPAHQIPEAPGGHYADLSGLTRRDRVVAILSFPHDRAPLDTDVLLLVTAQGKVKRVAFGDLFDVAQADPAVIGLDDGDELLWVGASAGGGEFMLITATGQAIRFPEDDVRTMGLPAGGIGGIRLAAKDRVVAAMCVAGVSANQRIAESARPTHLALVTTAGYGKRVPVADFPAQGRNGQGVVAAKLTDKSGEIAGAALAASRDVLICAFAKAVARPVVSADLAEMGRPAQGKPIVGLMVGQPVKSVCVLSMLTESRTSGGDTPKPDEAEDKTAPAAPAKRRTTKAATAPETASGREPAASRTATKAPAKTAGTRKSTASPAPQAETTTGTKSAGRRVKTDAPASVAPVTRAVPVKVDSTKAAPSPEAVAKPATRASRAAPKAAPKGEAEQLSLIPAAAPAPEEAPQPRRQSTTADGAKPASKPAAATKAKPTPPTKEDKDAAAGPAPKPGRASKQSEAASPPRTPARKPVSRSRKP